MLVASLWKELNEDGRPNEGRDGVGAVEVHGVGEGSGIGSHRASSELGLRLRVTTLFLEGSTAGWAAWSRLEGGKLSWGSVWGVFLSLNCSLLLRGF